MRVYFTFLFLLFCTFSANAQSSYYVNQVDGNDSSTGLSLNQAFESVEYAVDFLEPGDTLFFVGEFVNDSYQDDYNFSGNINDPYIWTQENTVRINNLNGTQNNYITLKAYNDETVMRGDGANIFRLFNCSYLRIEDFNIYGEVENISLETALALQFVYRESGSSVSLYRVQPGTPAAQVEAMTFPVLENIQRPSYTDTRGLYLSNVHHIQLLNNHIHHTTGNGFRVSNCDYIDIIGNEVNDCSRKSYSGTHGLVVTNAESFDNETSYKIFVIGNKIHHNFNEIYSWAPTKTIITPRIDEGKGISMQRNDEVSGWTHGRFLVANNLTYRNGYSGVHSNAGLRMDFINNTSYLNQYTNDVTYANGEQGGNNIGISVSGGNDFKIYNNITVVDASWGAFPISIRDVENIEIGDNLLYSINAPLSEDPDATAVSENTIIGNPLFVNAEGFDFALSNGSPAIGAANPDFAPDTDFFSNPRIGQSDLGAIERNSMTSIFTQKVEKINVFPNPCQETLFLEGEYEDLRIFDATGRDFTHLTTIENEHIDVRRLPIGIYFLHTERGTSLFVKID